MQARGGTNYVSQEKIRVNCLNIRDVSSEVFIIETVTKRKWIAEKRKSKQARKKQAHTGTHDLRSVVL